MTQNNASFDYAIHSNFLIHWTGNDFDKTKWYDESSSNTDNNLTQTYVKRLEDILKYGFWMTEGTNAPKIARTCFTELRLRTY